MPVALQPPVYEVHLDQTLEYPLIYHRYIQMEQAMLT